MGYKIIYGTCSHERNASRRIDFRWKALFVILGIFIVVLLVGNGISFQWLLPGDPAVTTAAMDNLRQNLQAGDPFGEAVTTFCQEIIAGAVQ